MTPVLAMAGLLVAFIFALALQLRLFAGIALRRAAVARFPDLEPGPARTAVAEAVTGEASGKEGRALDEVIAHLIETYPRPLSHIRLARRVCLVSPVALILLAVAWRLTEGMGG